MKLYAYYGMGERDQLITPNLSFAGMDEVYLNFRYAYSQRFNQKDSLIVYVSGNCGSTWNRVYAGGPDGTGIFATTMPVGSEFIPDEDNQWCGTGYGADCISIDLSAWSGNSDFFFMFESYNYLGNNLYIDDILISNTTGMVDLSAGQAGRISIYPNPNAGTFIISGSGIKEAIDILVVNIHGQEVWQGRCPCESGTLSQIIDISSFPGGVYFVKVADSNNIQVKKIIVH